MVNKNSNYSRRDFLLKSAGLAGIAAYSCGGGNPYAPTPQPSPSPSPSPTPEPSPSPSPTPEPSPSPTPPPNPYAVAISRAQTYDDAKGAMNNCFGLIGGIEDLVKGKQVTIKVNLTGNGSPVLGLSAMETYIVHDSVIKAVVSSLTTSGATKIRIVESAPVLSNLEDFVSKFGWDVPGIRAIGNVEFENTRNLGLGSKYSRLDVPGGTMYNYFDLNHSYAEDGVFISLAKMKNHRSAGVTLAMKNIFGITPNSLYGTDAPSENAVGNRFAMHDRMSYTQEELPGEKGVLKNADATTRVPYTIVDLCKARPIHLSIIEGIKTMAGGEGPWHEPTGELRPVSPGIIIVGRNAVSTDAVATATMGYEDALSTRRPPFHFCDNHIMLAHDAGLGKGDLNSIEVKGEKIEDVITKFSWI